MKGTVNNNTYVDKDLPIDQIQRDPDQPRRDFGTEGDGNLLLVSIKNRGMKYPIIVSEFEEGKYLIIDGHRRLICAQKLGYETVSCRIYPRSSMGELEMDRYAMQNVRKPWRPLERSDALERIKAKMGFRTNREFSEALGVAESSIANSLQLRREKMNYLGLMEKYDLAESYRIEFVRLKPKMRKIRDIEVPDIIEILFERVQSKVIKNAKEFRKLGRIFLRATANEEELYRFLTDPDITVKELDKRTTQSGFSLLIEQLSQKITAKKQEGVTLTSQEKVSLEQLRDLLNEIL
jgi:ParB/RepB/Spo0J family partition protein